MAVLKNPKTGNFYIRVKYYNKSYEKVIGKDRRKAELALNEIQQEIRLAKLANQNWEGFKKLQKAVRPKTFAEAARDYMEERANYKASSIRSYKSILDKHLVPAFGSSHFIQLTESQLRRFQVKLSSKLSPKRVNNIMLRILGKTAGHSHKTASCSHLMWPLDYIGSYQSVLS